MFQGLCELRRNSHEWGEGQGGGLAHGREMPVRQSQRLSLNLEPLLCPPQPPHTQPSLVYSLQCCWQPSMCRADPGLAQGLPPRPRALCCQHPAGVAQLIPGFLCELWGVIWGSSPACGSGRALEAEETWHL